MRVMILWVLLLAMPSSAAIAQSLSLGCADYNEAKGPEIVFDTDELAQKFGFQSTFWKPEIATTHATFAEIGGKRARLIGTDTSSSVLFWFHKAVLEDCRIVYINSSKETLKATSGPRHDFTFVSVTPEQLEAISPQITWVSNETVDAMTDEKSCYVTPGGLPTEPAPMFFYGARGRFSIQVINADFPGRPVTLRVDRNKAVSGDESLTGSRAQLIASQARAGKILLVAGYKWPYDYERLGEYPLAAIGPALDKCKKFAWGR